MKEHEQERFRTWRLAEHYLDEPNADPDDDLRMLSRQLLRAREIIMVVQPIVKGYAWEHRVGSNQKIAQWVETYLHGNQDDADQEKWRQSVAENNICRICGSSREVCGGEEKHG